MYGDDKKPVMNEIRVSLRRNNALSLYIKLNKFSTLSSIISFSIAL